MWPNVIKRVPKSGRERKKSRSESFNVRRIQSSIVGLPWNRAQVKECGQFVETEKATERILPSGSQRGVQPADI